MRETPFVDASLSILKASPSPSIGCSHTERTTAAPTTARQAKRKASGVHATRRAAGMDEPSRDRASVTPVK